ncbi:hypothetical protein ACFO3J_30600 [Streptomyces polygonati]|uniref:Uncharacterized protein n=1 Tax=Streptomyces polygonati TaxID=1617087 RepID=A0ABV8HXW5_9ACTN
MSLITPGQQHVVDVPRWTPPLEAAELRRFLDGLDEWAPLVLDDIFDDLNAAQTAHAGTDPAELERTAERLRKTLANLVNIGHTTPPEQLPPVIARTVEYAVPLLSEPGPIARERTLMQRLTHRGRRRDAVGELSRLRALAWGTEELVEQMSMAGLIKDES